MSLIAPLRGGGDALRTRPVTEPTHTVTAGGNHHSLIQPGEDFLTWADQLLVPYYGTARTATTARVSPVSAPESMPAWLTKWTLQV